MFLKLKPQSEFSKNVLTLMTGTTIAQSIPIAISPILTRIYTPEDFGVFAIYLSILSILAVIATGRYELAIMLPKQNRDAINIVALSFLIALSISLLLLIIIFLFKHHIVLLLGNKEIENWLYFIPLSLFIFGLSNSLNYWNNRNKNYTLIAKAKINQSLGGGVVNLGLGFMQFSKFGLILGQLFGQIVSLIILLKVFIINDFAYINGVNRLKIYALSKKYYRFPKINLPHAFLNTLSSNLPVLIISKFFNSSNVGFYSLSNLIVVIPMGIVSSAYSQVFLQKILELKKNRIVGSEIEFFKETVFKLLLYSASIFIVIFVFTEDIFAIVFSEEWRVAGVYTKILIPMLYLRFTGSIVSSIVIVYDKQYKALIIEILNIFLRFSALIVGGLYGSIILGLVLFSIFSSLISLYRLFWYFKIVKEGSL